MNVLNVSLKTLWTALLDYPPYSPNLAPSDFHIFPKLLKNCLVGIGEELKENVTNRFKSQATEFYDAGIQKLGSQLNKFLDINVGYEEK